MVTAVPENVANHYRFFFGEVIRPFQNFLFKKRVNCSAMHVRRRVSLNLLPFPILLCQTMSQLVRAIDGLGPEELAEMADDPQATAKEVDENLTDEIVHQEAIQVSASGEHAYMISL